eukprot:TRINITY_DN9203_c0_g1_i2.p1 TRINITY_DN9203_c0_g1~~TRINITY_DN9203_c0_g1_i2.p1  ORF type:complete len:206 (-),score=21.90 TRINITY_DN9203_c0_g1_i2:108-725(-)
MCYRVEKTPNVVAMAALSAPFRNSGINMEMLSLSTISMTGPTDYYCDFNGAGLRTEASVERTSSMNHSSVHGFSQTAANATGGGTPNAQWSVSQYRPDGVFVNSKHNMFRLKPKNKTLRHMFYRMKPTTTVGEQHNGGALGSNANNIGHAGMSATIEGSESNGEYGLGIGTNSNNVAGSNHVRFAENEKIVKIIQRSIEDSDREQ